MSEELQKALGELLSKANNGINTAGDFLAAELPDVIQQLLMWHGVKSLIVFLLCLIIPIIFYRLSMKIARSTFLSDGKELFDYPHVIIPMAIMSIVILVVSTARINVTWLQIWIAPKVWLIEYAAKLAG